MTHKEAVNDLNTIKEFFEQESGAYPISLEYAIGVLKNGPSADRPQGEWKRRLVDNGFNADWVCSECGYRVKTDFVSFNFCPNCGADMRERRASDED